MDDLIKELDAINRELGTIKGIIKDIKAERAEIDKHFSVAPNAVLRLTGLEKAYFDAVKAGNGLTSVRPSAVKAIAAVEKKLSTQTVKAAISALQQHVDEVQKSDGSDKRFSKFQKEMKGVCARLDHIA